MYLKNRFYFIFSFLLFLLFFFAFNYIFSSSNSLSASVLLSQNQSKNQSIATGFFINDSGYLVTSNHVIKDKSKIFVLVKKTKAFKATIIKVDEQLDLALLKINSITPYLYLAHSKGVPAGMDVVTIGYPQAGLLGLNPKITRGIVNSSSGIKDNKNTFQFSAEVQQGNSGGPLIAPGGTVVGVVQAKLDALKLSEKTNDLTQNVNFATKSAVLLDFLKGISTIPATQPLLYDQPMHAVRIYDETKGAIIPIVAKN